MSMSMILYGIGAIVLLGAIASLFRAVNAPKVEKEKTAQEVEDTKQQAQRQEHRETVIDRRLTFREKMREWRRNRGRRGQPVQNEMKNGNN